MASIDVDFDVYKALTLRRATEATTYNDVIRDLLGLGRQALARDSAPAQGATYKGVFFSDGTQFQATYKSKRYTASIKGGVWIDGATREARTSPSHAAHKLTGTNVNGWRFWRCKRPGENRWTLLDKLQ